MINQIEYLRFTLNLVKVVKTLEFNNLFTVTELSGRNKSIFRSSCSDLFLIKNCGHFLYSSFFQMMRKTFQSMDKVHRLEFTC